jgi:beta-glucanase (GH16 family)
MKNLLVLLVFAAITVPGCTKKFHNSIFEDFDSSGSEYFRHSTGGRGADFTWTFGAESPTEPGKKVLLLRIDPEDNPGAGRGPDIVSEKFTHFGTYSARIKVPDIKDIQPDVGAVVGYFTYYMDNEHGLSEIDFEWLIADPTIIYVGTWTGPRGDLRRIGRTINMAEGIIYSTSYREQASDIRTPLTGEQSQPETIDPVESFDASSQFYTYGFDWYPDRVRWWMIHPETADTIVLWDYQGSMKGIPQNHTRYLVNFWHTNNWPVQTNPNSIEKPLHPYEAEIAWMSYEPMKKRALRKYLKNL